MERATTSNTREMVYSLYTVDECPEGLGLKTDKPLCTWDIESFPDLDIKGIKECEEGLRMAKQGVKQMLDSNIFTYFHFDMYECGVAMGDNEWYLLCLVLLKLHGCISLNSKAIFSSVRQHSAHIPKDIPKEGEFELADDSIFFFAIAHEETNMFYDLDYMGNSVFIQKKTMERITIHDMEKHASDWAEKSPTVQSFMTVRMDVVDFCSMFARCDVLGKEEKGRDTLGRVLAVLMGTHKRLGAKSPLLMLDAGVVGMIILNVLPAVIREAVEAGVVRF